MRKGLALLITLTILTLAPWTAAAEKGDITIRVSDPDREVVDAEGRVVDDPVQNEGSTINEVLGVPRVKMGDNQALGALRISGKPGHPRPIQVGNKVKVTLPVGVAYMKTPTAETLDKYVAFPPITNWLVNSIANGESTPALRFVEGTPRSLTVEVTHVRDKGTPVLEFMFNRENFSSVRVSELLNWGGTNVTNPQEKITRQEFFLNLLDVTASFKAPNVSVKFVGDVQSLVKFSDRKDVARGLDERIAALVEAGLVQGRSGDMLDLSGFITREEAAVLVAKVVGNRESTTIIEFNDQIPSWAADSVALAVAKGLIKGYPDGSFRADQAITREEAAVLLQRLFEHYSSE